MHSHDYAEVFWTEGGKVRHQINDTETQLAPGSVVLIRPDDRHGFTTAPGEMVNITNVSFTLEILKGIRRRYFASIKDFFWSKDRLPWTRKLSTSQLRKLNGWADELSRAPREPMHIDRFLLNALAEFSSSGEHAFPEETPDWLTRACTAAPDHLAEGVEGFFRLCGRSREHVARTMRRILKTTPTDYVNMLRMGYSRHHLEMGDRPILNIAMDCGFEDLSHFYTLFRRETGTTPRAYRMNCRRQWASGRRRKDLPRR